MKKFIIVLCVCFALTGCILKGKKVVLTDAKTGTELTVTEDGLIVEGSIPVGGVQITVSEDNE